MGILNHTVGAPDDTMEATAVRLSDRIAYINHDIEDAISAGVLSEDDLPPAVTDVLGHSKNQRITTLITSLVENTREGRLAMAPQVDEQYKALHGFMYSTVYVDKMAKAEEAKVEKLLAELYAYFLRTPERMPSFYLGISEQEGIHRAVTDYLSGMSDDFAIRTFETLFVPRKWTL